MKSEKPEPKIILSGAYRNRFAESVETLEECVFRDIEQLFRFGADGNEAAAKSFYRIAGLAVKHLEKFCHHWPEGFEPLARKASVWPGWLTCDANVERRNAALLKKLNLGLEAELNYSGKQWSLEKKETAIAVQLYDRVKGAREAWARRGETRKALREFKKEFPAFANRRVAQPKPDAKVAAEFALYKETAEIAKRLLPLTRQNYTQWFKAAWPTFIAWYGNDFQNHKHFAHYRENAAFSEPDPNHPGKNKLRSTARALIREAIKNSIKQAFRSIAPKIPINRA